MFDKILDHETLVIPDFDTIKANWEEKRKEYNERFSKYSELICMHFDVPLEDLWKRTRKREVVYARQTMLFVLNSIEGLKPSVIQRMTKFDHATVNYSVQNTIDMYDTDFDFRTMLNELIGSESINKARKYISTNKRK